MFSLYITFMIDIIKSHNLEKFYYIFLTFSKFDYIIAVFYKTQILYFMIIIKL
jgi:hypothetical protein